MIDPNRELLDRAQTETYKETAEGELSVHLFAPASDGGTSGKAAMLFFFGSLWDQGTNTQFAPHCTYFAARGILTGIVDYRISNTHGTTPLDAVSDARSAFRWLRSRADDLGINPRKIVGAGASGGAHIVFCSSMTPEPDCGNAQAENTSISGAPDCHIGFSPVLDTSPKGVGFDRFPDAKAARALNPLTHIARGLPPSLIFHGTRDRVVPFEGSRRFAKKMQRKKNICELITFEGQDHSFFNCNVNLELYSASLKACDRFLVEQELIAPTPEEPIEAGGVFAEA